MSEDAGRDRSGARRDAVAPALVALALSAMLIWPYGWWAVGRPPFSAGAAAAVLVPGVAAAGVAGAARFRRGPGRPPRAASGLRRWVGLAALAAAWQLAAYLQQPRHDHPTLSSLANAVLDTHAPRTAAFVAWLAVTVALVRR